MIKDWEQFFKAVSKMRVAQKLYFKTKDRIIGADAKELESLVDGCITERNVRKQEGAS